MKLLVSQTTEFTLTVALGLLLGMFFHAYHVIMKRIGLGRFALYFFDLLFWLLMVVPVFLALLLINHGEMRSHVLVALILGALIYRMYLWKKTDKLMSAAAEGLTRVCSQVFRSLSYPWVNAYRSAKSQIWALFANYKGPDDEEIK